MGRNRRLELSHRCLQYLLTAVVFAVLAQPVLAKDQKKTIAVMDLDPGGTVSKGEARIYTDALIQAVDQQYQGKVSSQADVRSLVDAQVMQQVLGCEDERCVANTANALAVDELLTGRISKMADTTLVFLALIEPKQGSVRARASHTVKDKKQVLSEMAKAAKQLFSANARKYGDVELTDLRTALLFEEYDHKGVLQKSKVTQTCMSDLLLQSQVPMVSPAMVDQIKKQASLQQLQSGRIPDSLTTEHVDVLILARVEKRVRENQVLGEKTFNCRAEMSLTMVKVDTAEILVSKQIADHSTGHWADQVESAVSRKICQTANQTLREALGQRKDNGNRIVVELIGDISQGDVQTLASELTGVRAVKKIKVRSFTPKKATLNLVAVGGDGIAVAIDIGRAKLSSKVVAAGPASVRLQKR